MQSTKMSLSIPLVIALLSTLSGCAATPERPHRGAGGDVGSAELTQTTPPPGFMFCAAEYQRCNFRGTRTVAYGANGVYSYRTATDGIDCNNANFGDPLVGVDKSCYVR